MDYQQIDILEDKINMAVELISRLKNENRELKKQNMEMKQLVEKNNEALQKLQADYDALLAKQEEANEYQAREAKVKDKVEGMLNKLNAIQLSL